MNKLSCIFLHNVLHANLANSLLILLFFLPFRFVHQLKETHASIKARSNHVTAAMVTVRQARSQAASLEERIVKEEVILTEKREACLKLLTQVGQDTAILEQHTRLLTKQRERIAHLKKVCECVRYLCTHGGVT